MPNESNSLPEDSQRLRAWWYAASGPRPSENKPRLAPAFRGMAGMRRSFAMRMAAITLLFCACTAPFTVARAENGRDFAGQYQLSGVVESNGTVTAMLTVRIFNYSGQDIWGARVQLAGPQQTVIGDNIGFANHTHQVIRAVVTVPATEFARWWHGPALTVEWRQTDGSLARRPVELIRAAAIGEVQ